MNYINFKRPLSFCRGKLRLSQSSITIVILTRFPIALDFPQESPNSNHALLITRPPPIPLTLLLHLILHNIHLHPLQLHLSHPSNTLAEEQWFPECQKECGGMHFGVGWDSGIVVGDGGPEGGEGG